MTDTRPTVLINPRPDYAGDVAQKVFPPVGLMYLAAAMKQADEPVRVIDANAMNLDDSGVIAMLERLTPFAVGVPVFAGLLPATAALIKAIRDRFPDLPIFAGGPEATFNPGALAGWIPQIDHFLLGEAEESLVAYVKELRSGRQPTGIPGVLTSGESADGTTPARILNLDRIPIPDRGCVSENYANNRYYTLLVPDRRLDCIVTSRGCPHRCTFCYNWRFKQAYRSIDNCLDEISTLYERGTKTIEILDDNFTANPDRAHQFFKALIAQRWPIRFRIKARADAVDETLMREARRAGVYQVSIGIESADPGILAAMRKRITPEMAMRSIRTVMDLGMYCHASFIVGFPGETPETMDANVRFIRAAAPTTVALEILAPYGGTALYEQARADGTLVGDWTSDPRAEQPWIRLPWTSSRQDLVNARRSMLFRIYWNPTYAFRYARMIVGEMNPTMGRYLLQETARTWPGLKGLVRGARRRPR
ncbi:MAG TPA: radical SAM protein [Myxococcota bacterium]|nr:radical SAM protein [Myxococcota bacterium]